MNDNSQAANKYLRNKAFINPLGSSQAASKASKYLGNKAFIDPLGSSQAASKYLGSKAFIAYQPYFEFPKALNQLLHTNISGKILYSDLTELLGLERQSLTAQQYKNNQLLTTKEFFDYQDAQPVKDQAALSPSEYKTRIEERNNAGKAAKLINWDILVQEAENAASEDSDETNYPNINEDFYLENKKFDLYSPQLMKKIVLFSWNAFIGIGGVSASIEAILQVINFLKTH